jgi:hypothetical protein
MDGVRMEASGIAWVAFLAAGAICQASICRAALLVDPGVGGLVLMNGANGEDEVVPLNRTFGGRFYGESVGLGTSRPVFVSENGNLNFSNNGTFSKNAKASPSRYILAFIASR